MTAAPLYSELAEGPDAGEAWWLRTDDGVRIRAGLWGRDKAERGTVFLFPGRTEYIEKYGRTATDLAEYGYATLAIDWRGQGLSDRLLSDPMPGHVHDFRDYQRDVAALVAAAQEQDLPKPWFLLAHSMGGCIGLRALMEGLPVQACAYTGPMWGIHMVDALRPVAWSLSWSSRQIGMGHVYAPGTASESYVLIEPFETNKLTHDRDMYDYMIRQVKAHPEFGLGGPSLRWLHEALKECRTLWRRPSPDFPCMTMMGQDEEIVDASRIRDRMARWPGSQFKVVERARHEVLMEAVETRAAAIEAFCAFFCGSGEPDHNGSNHRGARLASGDQA